MQVRTTIDPKEAENLKNNLYLKETNLNGNLLVSPSCKYTSRVAGELCKIQKKNFSNLSMFHVDF